MMKEGTMELFNGKDLAGWKVRQHHPGRASKWVVHDGILENTDPGVDLITEQEFGDFELHIEYLVPEDGNSGVFLRMNCHSDEQERPVSMYVGFFHPGSSLSLGHNIPNCPRHGKTLSLDRSQ